MRSPNMLFFDGNDECLMEQKWCDTFIGIFKAAKQLQVKYVDQIE